MLSVTDHAHGHGRGHSPPLLQTPLQAPQEAPKGLPCVGAMLRGPAGPPSPFLRLAWPGTGVGWHAPVTLICVENDFSCSARPPHFSPGREHGGQPAPDTTFVSALLPPSPAPLGFPQTPVCHAKGIPEIK